MQDTAVRLGTSRGHGGKLAHILATPRYTSKLNVGHWKLNLVYTWKSWQKCWRWFRNCQTMAIWAFNFKNATLRFGFPKAPEGFLAVQSPGSVGRWLFLPADVVPLRPPKIRPQWFDGCIVERMFVGCAERKGSIRVYMKVCLEGRESASAIPYLSFNVWVRDSC